ncbi:hypothetical protein ZWY2020_005698 [Hordeum vulgare]|nr:hypothetical protein ZWY2020_005698 [Hordeum vulgare]
MELCCPATRSRSRLTAPPYRPALPVLVTPLTRPRLAATPHFARFLPSLRFATPFQCAFAPRPAAASARRALLASRRPAHSLRPCLSAFICSLHGVANFIEEQPGCRGSARRGSCNSLRWRLRRRQRHKLAQPMQPSRQEDHHNLNPGLQVHVGNVVAPKRLRSWVMESRGDCGEKVADVANALFNNRYHRA